MKKLYIAIQFTFLIILTAAASAQTAPKLVKSFGMLPGTFAGLLGVDFHGKFVTDSLGSLLISDGTDTGTHSIVSGFYNIEAMCVSNGKLFFIGCDSLIHGNELWVSDGTTAGTHLVKEVNPLPNATGCYYFGFNDFSLIAFNNKVFFYGNDGVHGVELWRSDGTDTGTAMVKDINTTPGADVMNLATFPFGAFQVAGGKLFFCADDGINGPELWVTDGTEANTHMVADLAGGSDGSNPQYLTALDNKMCFWTAAGGETYLYITDGTDTGTHFLTSNILTPNSEHAVLNHKLYFFADSNGVANSSSLWVTDGTAAGTSWISHAFYGTIQFSYYAYLSSFLTAWNGKVYFGGADHLWSSTGTTGGTQMVTDFSLNPGLCCTPTHMTDFGGKMYMRVRSSSGRVEICSSNGTDTGTHVAVCPTANYTSGSLFVIQNSLSYPLTVVGNKLFFWNTYEEGLGHSLYTIDLPGTAVANTTANHNELKIFPNPAKDAITVESGPGDKINKVEIYDISGRMLTSIAINQQDNATIQLPETARNMVFVKIYAAAGITVTKVELEGKQ